MANSFQSRFGQAACAYSTFRPEYPAALFERILRAVPAGRRNCAMDLGAGTGKATRVLGQFFARVIAVEADALMAAELREEAPGAEVRITTAEECRQDASSVDLVNVAQALHWMDIPRVIANAARWLRAQGILAVYGGEFPKMPPPLREIVRREFDEHWNQFRDERLKRKEFPQSILRATSALKLIEDTSVPHIVPMTPHEFAGFCRSTSYGSAYGRTLADGEAYWRDLESRFRESWREAKIPLDCSAYLFLLQKE